MGGLLTNIRLKYVHAFVDRHGRPRFYFRRKGKHTALPGLPGSQAFMSAYQDALTSTTEGAGKPKGGPKSVSALFASYYCSPGFQRLAPSSQRLYRQALKPIETAHGHRGVVDLPDDKAHKIIEEIGATRPGMANLTRSVLRRAFAHAVKPLKWRYTNPFAEIESYKVGTHHTWTDADFAAKALEFGLPLLGARFATSCSPIRQAVDRRNDHPTLICGLGVAFDFLERLVICKRILDIAVMGG
jgi:hypothetical protein